MLRNMAASLIIHERVITTVEKAKELRPFIEKIITKAKRGTLHDRRLVRSLLGPAVTCRTKEGEDKLGGPYTGPSVLKKLFDEIGPRFAERPGGYTRVIKRHNRRLGDGGVTAFIELLKAGETRERERVAPAPAPRVTEPAAPAQTPSAETPPAAP